MITFLRHAPIPKKYQNRYIGHSDISIDLSLVDKSKLKKIKNMDFDLIYCSDLIRCTQTLDLFSFKYTKSVNLREVKFKSFVEKKSFSEIEKLDSFDNEYLDSNKSWHQYICEESFDNFESRCKTFLEKLPKGKNILICSHAGVIKKMYWFIKNEELNEIDYLDTISISDTYI